jgi:hypothetical protein
VADGELNHVDLDDAHRLWLLRRGIVSTSRLPEGSDPALDRAPRRLGADVTQAADAFNALADPAVTAEQPSAVLEAPAEPFRGAPPTFFRAMNS